MCVCVGWVCQDSIQVHLKAEQGPILVLACDVGAGEETYSCFLTLEESRIQTAELDTGRSHNQLWLWSFWASSWTRL